MPKFGQHPDLPPIIAVPVLLFSRREMESLERARVILERAGEMCEDDSGGWHTFQGAAAAVQDAMQSGTPERNA